MQSLVGGWRGQPGYEALKIVPIVLSRKEVAKNDNERGRGGGEGGGVLYLSFCFTVRKRNGSLLLDDFAVLLLDFRWEVSARVIL